MPRSLREFPAPRAALDLDEMVGEAMAIGRSFPIVQKALRSWRRPNGFNELYTGRARDRCATDKDAVRARWRGRRRPPAGHRPAYRPGRHRPRSAPRASTKACFRAGPPSCGRRARAREGFADDATALLRLSRWVFRRASRRARRRPRTRRFAPPGARRAPGLQAHRHLRRRVRLADAHMYSAIGRRVTPANATAARARATSRPSSARPNRIGRASIRLFCVHAATASRRPATTIMVNCNPETCRRLRHGDRLYFEP